MIPVTLPNGNGSWAIELLDQELACALRGEFDSCRDILAQLTKIYPDDLRYRFNQGWFLLRDGKFQEGYEKLEAGRHLKAYGNAPIPTDRPIWNPRLHLLKGKTIILALEGGYGDEMLCARFARSLHELGGRVVLMAHPDLHGLMGRIPNVERVISVREVRGTPHDYWLPAFSAAWVCGYDNATLLNDPYLSAAPEAAERWGKTIRGAGLKVGLRWAGNPQFEHHQHRKFPVGPLLDLARSPGAKLYSLQRDDDLVDLPRGITDLRGRLTSWEETAGAIAQLDLVITSCTSVAHLAAAMGKPTWVLVPILPYHCWSLPGDSSPWYRTARLFRQTKFQDWNECFDKLGQEFRALLDQRGKKNA